MRMQFIAAGAVDIISERSAVNGITFTFRSSPIFQPSSISKIMFISRARSESRVKSFKLNLLLIITGTN